MRPLSPILPLLVAACSSLTPDPGSPWHPPPVGTILVVYKPLEIPTDRTRLFLQKGRLRDKFDQYLPVCAFEVRRIDRKKARTLIPMRLRVRRVEQIFTEVVRAASLRVAALHLAGWDSGGRPMIHRGWRLWFEPTGGNPEPLRLSCYGALDTPDRALPPSLPEMAIALGPGFRLQRPPAGRGGA